MIPDVSFETIENNPQAAYNKAISHLVAERVCLFSYSRCEVVSSSYFSKINAFT